MGNAKAIYQLFSGKNSACVSFFILLIQDTIDVEKVQILTQYSHHLTFLFTCTYFDDHSLTQVGLPIFEWVIPKLHCIYLSLRQRNGASVNGIRYFIPFIS